MLLFTSDLDRTLIYSKRMMSKYLATGEIIPIEYKGDQVISYMSQHSIDLLCEVNEKHFFVPVTTRSKQQYERISIFQQDIRPKYAITSNGGTIFVDGAVDVEWDQVIRKKIADTAISGEDLLTIFTDMLHEEWIIKVLHMDALFYTFYIDLAKVALSELQALDKELKKYGWQLFLHGKKMVVLPIQLNKASAITYLQNHVDYELHIAAGDSMMDYDMLLQADIGYSPKHGELFEEQAKDTQVKWLHEQGANATEELLREILKLKAVECKR